MTKFLCERLGKQHDRKGFTCGVPQLDDYLWRQAGQDMRRRVAAVFVMVPLGERSRISGYYSLSSASIILSELPDEIVTHLPRYPVVPAVLIGRLARDVAYPGVGKLLLFDALARSLRHTDEVAAAVVLVDAKNRQAREFYNRHGFLEVAKKTNRLFLPMKTVEIMVSTTWEDV